MRRIHSGAADIVSETDPRGGHLGDGGESEVLQVAKDYIIAKTRFADDKEQKTLREAAEKDATYYQTHIDDVRSVKDLLADRKLVDIVLVAHGLEPDKVSTADQTEVVGPRSVVVLRSPRII